MSSSADELDRLLETYLAALDRYQANQHSLAAALKLAFLDLARAKQALGASRVGPSSYDLSETQARFAVVTHVSEADPVALTFALEPTLIPVLDEEAVLAPENDSAALGSTVAAEAGLRQRKVVPTPLGSVVSAPATPAAPPVEEFVGADISSSDKAPAPPSAPRFTSPRDPLLQFSAFPPPALRSSAVAFGSSINSALRVVEAEMVLSELARRIELVKLEIARAA